MRIHIIACRIFARELSYLAAKSDNTIDITWLGRGLHNEPANLRSRLSDTVDELYHQMETGELEYRPDAIVLGYGLCSNGVIGVRCRDIPIVVPRTDDCIALFMGSQEMKRPWQHMLPWPFSHNKNIPCPITRGQEVITSLQAGLLTCAYGEIFSCDRTLPSRFPSD